MTHRWESTTVGHRLSLPLQPPSQSPVGGSRGRSGMIMGVVGFRVWNGVPRDPLPPGLLHRLHGFLGLSEPSRAFEELRV